MSSFFTSAAKAVNVRNVLVVLAIFLVPLPIQSATPPFVIVDGANDLPAISIEWGVISNYDKKLAKATSELVLVNRGSVPLDAQGWALYFNCSCGFVSGTEQGLRLSHLNGDFYKLEPTQGFLVLSQGNRARIVLKAGGAVINYSMAPQGFYFEFQDARENIAKLLPVKDVRVKPFVAEQMTRDRVDLIPMDTPELRYLRNSGVRALPVTQIGRVVPTPLETTNADGTVVLGASTEIRYAPGFEKVAAFAADSLSAVLTAKPRVAEGTGQGASTIVLAMGRPCDDRAFCSSREAYRIQIEAGRGITITGNSAAGVFYGMQTLRALLPVESYKQSQAEIALPAVNIIDSPRFPYRAAHLDVARNFQTKPAVLKLLDVMAFYKLNTLELHLADDEGWRLEVPGLPELTEIGARRGHTTDELENLVPSYGSGPDANAATSVGNGFYTTNDFIEILQYAHARHIEVIPEIESIGHARAAIKSMQARYAKFSQAGQPEKAAEYLLNDPNDRSTYESVQGWHDNVVNVCRESSYRFFAKVFGEIVNLYHAAGVPAKAIHIGGDEVPRGAWLAAPSCQKFLNSAKSRDAGEALRSGFIEKLITLVNSKGLTIAAWEEAALQENSGKGPRHKQPIQTVLNKRLLVYAWDPIWGDGNQENAYKLANAGYDVILGSASNLYFDLAYAKDSEETGLYWAGFVSLLKPYEFSPFNLYACAHTDVMGNPIDPNVLFRDSLRLTEAGKRHILGLQGHLWGETVKGQEAMEYMMFPRLLALAERAWAKEPAWEEMPAGSAREALLQQEWNEFLNRLGFRELPRLAFLQGGLNYRLAPPGAVIADGTLKANAEIPGESIRYTTDGNEPTAQSKLYDGPTSISGVVKLRTFDARGRGSRVAVVEAK